jgi:hypothetical protein
VDVFHRVLHFGVGAGRRRAKGRFVKRPASERGFDRSGSEGLRRKSGDADADIFTFAAGDPDLGSDTNDGKFT